VPRPPVVGAILGFFWDGRQDDQPAAFAVTAGGASRDVGHAYGASGRTSSDFRMTELDTLVASGGPLGALVTDSVNHMTVNAARIPSP
jgi:hypothetical protein